VEGSGMKALMAVVAPGIAIPSRRTIARLVPDIKRGLLAELRSNIRLALGVSLTADHWTADVRGGSPFFGVTVTTISPKFTMSTQLLALRYSPEKHDSAHVAAALEEVTEAVGLTAAGVGSVTTDRGSAMPGGVDGFFGDTSGAHIYCFGHVLNSTWDYAVKNITELKAVVSAVRSLVFLYCQSPVRRALLQRACEAQGIAPKRIIFSCPTRWWAETHMLERAVYLFPAFANVNINAFPSITDDVRRKHAECLTMLDKHKDLLKLVVLPVCAIWEAWQVKLSSATEPTAHLVGRAILNCLVAPQNVKSGKDFAA